MNTLHEQPPLKGGRTNWNRMGNTPVVSLAVDTVSRLRRLSGPSDWLWRALPRFVIGSHWNRFAFPVCVITLSSRFSIVGPTILGRNRSIFRVGNVFFFQRLVLVFFFLLASKTFIQPLERVVPAFYFGQKETHWNEKQVAGAPVFSSFFLFISLGRNPPRGSQTTTTKKTKEKKRNKKTNKKQTRSRPRVRGETRRKKNKIKQKRWPKNVKEKKRFSSIKSGE